MLRKLRGFSAPPRESRNCISFSANGWEVLAVKPGKAPLFAGKSSSSLLGSQAGPVSTSIHVSRQASFVATPASRSPQFRKFSGVSIFGSSTPAVSALASSSRMRRAANWEGTSTRWAPRSRGRPGRAGEALREWARMASATPWAIGVCHPRKIVSGVGIGVHRSTRVGYFRNPQ